MSDLAQGASVKLAAHAAGIRYEALPPPVIHAFKRALLDHVTCALAGSAMPVSRALLSYFEETDAAIAAPARPAIRAATLRQPAARSCRSRRKYDSPRLMRD